MFSEEYSWGTFKRIGRKLHRVLIAPTRGDPMPVGEKRYQLGSLTSQKKSRARGGRRTLPGHKISERKRLVKRRIANVTQASVGVFEEIVSKDHH